VDAGAYRLEDSTSAKDLIDHHASVVEAARPRLKRTQQAFDFVANRPHTPEELEVYRRKKKIPVSFPLAKTAERAIVGLWISNKYDVSFMPFEPNDQDTSTLRQICYQHTEYTQDWKLLDVDIFRQGWAAGSANQEFWADVKPGRMGPDGRPEDVRLRTTNQNAFGIFWDPESRQLITRYDAQYVDRVSWQEWSGLCKKFPDVLKEEDWARMIDNTNEVEKTDRPYREMGFLDIDVRNRRVKVIERFYKVYTESHYMQDAELKKVRLDAEAAKAFAGQFTYTEDEEQLNVAVVCPRWVDRAGEGKGVNGTGYLYNGPYHCQPRDPQSGHIIWPILEFAAENLQGEALGFIDPMIGPIKVVNSTMANIYHNSRHQAGTSLIRKDRVFLGENKKDFDKNHTDADRVFVANDEADLTADIVPVPKGNVSADTYKALDYAKLFAEEVSSAPPALKGFSEASGTSGVLNAQRIEQAVTQLQVINQSWRLFLRQRAKLAQYYWKTYWTREKLIRVTNMDALKKGPDFWSGDISAMQQQVAHPMPQIPGLIQQGGASYVQMNGMKPAVDAFGQETGAIETFNDITQDEYDVVIEDSYQSPTYAERTKQELVQLLANPGVQADPQLLGALTLEYARYSNLSQETKKFINTWSTLVQQRAMQQQAADAQAQQLQQTSTMQEIAQREVDQTQPMPGQRPQPGRPRPTPMRQPAAMAPA
jgi:hypothetical protein